MAEQQKKLPAAVYMLQTSFCNRGMIFKLAKNDFKTKYAGSYLGIMWAFVQPIITILLYWFVFQICFPSPSVGEYPFVLWLSAGLVPWFFFSDAWNGATNSLLEYSFLVKKVVFDIEILPVIKIVSAYFIHLFFTLFVLLLFILNMGCPSVHVIQLLYCHVCSILLTCGLAYFTSAIVVFIRDLSHLLGVALQLLMWLTPIMWQTTMIQEYTWLFLIMKLNPVFYIVQCFRDAMLSGPWFWEYTAWTAYFWILTLLLYVGGTVVFHKLKPHFADVL